MKLNLRGLLYWTVIFLSMCLINGLVRAESASISFGPPDGIVWVERKDRSVEETSWVADATNRTTELSEEKWTTLLIFSKVAEGYIVSQITTQCVGTLNGKPFENPAVRIFLGKTNDLHISEGGKFTGMDCPDDLIEELKAIAPSSMHESLQKHFLENCKNEEESTWFLECSRFSGKKFQKGDVWSEAAEHGSSKSRLFTKSLINNIGHYKDKRIVEILCAFSTNEAEIGKFSFANFATEVRQKFLQGPPTEPRFVRGFSVQVFDAATQLPLKCQSSVISKDFVSGKWVLRIENKSKSYTQGR